MKKLKFVVPTDPILWRPAEPVYPTDDLSFVDAMLKVFQMSANAVGLAAPQLGISKRLIMTRPYKSSLITIMVNPSFTPIGTDTDTMKEGCLSFPGITAAVSRFSEIITYYYPCVSGRIGELISREHSGWEARINQHEIDHLDGRCLVGEEWKRGNQSR